MNKLQRDGEEAAESWEGINGRKLNVFDKFLVPVEAGRHWILLEIDFDRSAINILDSLGKTGTKMGEALAGFLRFQGMTETFVIRFPKVPKQHNLHDCGVFILQFAKFIFEGTLLDEHSFNWRQGLAIRERILGDLLTAVSLRDR
jgi:Ulp1 family protease